ncbi:LytTR family transcriptional regulator DNA-binding domain-containing protein [Lactobacillus sp. ESL0791]|uniref:LytTR family transcriptional regulator DNA-binding domain-containing protein n=1 Tax=Lactobacillus sp. ESL0791 TaxID=2983234 RepID=UPI0023F81F9F|nr:LytTR family transcriptional regulator DNA-binding domain-containing protein [Lactobacillus sp. ESL0791]MDF7638218.1 LytTR family transcriptional regulator DNA-binding domain-containing protein [Lactobacillus sp. ESL0791]
MKILIVDDEPLARDELEYLIKKSPSLKGVSVTTYQAEDIKEAQAALLKNHIDLMFLDISLNEENGFELADELKELTYQPMIIFATAYDEYAVRAFNVGAVDYVLKPFEQKRIATALEKAMRVLALNKNSSNTQAKPPADAVSEMLSIELADRSVVIKKADLITATVSDGILTITTHNAKYETKHTLAWIKEKLTDCRFMQVHRNAIINVESIKEVQPWFNHTLLLIMSNGEKVQVGRAYRKELNKRLGM